MNMKMNNLYKYLTFLTLFFMSIFAQDTLEVNIQNNVCVYDNKNKRKTIGIIHIHNLINLIN